MEHHLGWSLIQIACVHTSMCTNQQGIAAVSRYHKAVHLARFLVFWESFQQVSVVYEGIVLSVQVIHVQTAPIGCYPQSVAVVLDYIVDYIAVYAVSILVRGHEVFHLVSSF